MLLFNNVWLITQQLQQQQQHKKYAMIKSQTKHTTKNAINHTQ